MECEKTEEGIAMNGKVRFLVFAGLAGLSLVLYSTGEVATTVEASSISGTGTLSGTVKASKPFKAAQVFARNVDKNALYLVYTSGGRYRAINVMPGNYEVTVRKRGFQADAQKLVVKAGANVTADFTLREAEPEPIRAGGFAVATGAEVQLVSYDTLYPPGPDRDVTERTCIWCHGRSFFPHLQKTEAEWNAAVDLMTSSEAFPVRGAQIPPGTLSAKDRQTVVAYLTKHFGPNSPKRELKIDVEMPLDEQALGRAMYIEYYLPLDKSPKRRGQDPYFDNDGNVWYTDRGIPNMVGKVDPRTATFTDYPLPDPKADPHGLTVDSEGNVFWAETRGLHLGRLDPKTGKMVRYPMDPDGIIKGGSGHTPVLDSKENVWFTVITGNKLGKWDRKTEKVTLWEVPTPSSSPYGILVDKNDKIWFSEFRRGKVARFDPVTEKFSEYPALTQPCTIRRLGMDSKGTIWYGGFSSGKLGKVDPSTGKIVEYDIPMPFSEPYDTWPDPEDNIWISDGGQGGALIKFDPRTEKFTYYPTPQRTDQPKLEITREGAIWYCPRSSANAAVGVLYPDVATMTLAAYY